MKYRSFARILALATCLCVISGISFVSNYAYAEGLFEQGGGEENLQTEDEASLEDDDLDVAESSVSGNSVAEEENSQESEVDTSSTEDELPPDPVHMWSGSGTGEDSISLFANQPYWNSDYSAFYEGTGNLFASPAMFVIDVSHHNEVVDWEAFKRAYPNGGAILRCGYGNSGTDRYFERNIAEVKRLGIPYGVYLYSYAYDENYAAEEGRYTAEILQKYGVDPELGIFYDLEAFTPWNGHTHPTSPAVYERIVRRYYQELTSRGWLESEIHVYSYVGYLNGELNSDYIRSLATWVARYNSYLGYTITAPGQHGWQYSSTGRVTGVNGYCDMNAFMALEEPVDLPSLGYKDTSVAEGDYLLLSALSGVGGKTNGVIDIAWADMGAGAPAALYRLNAQTNQQFHVKPQGDGTYTISAVHSGKYLGVSSDSLVSGDKIVQTDKAQKWEIYRDPSGYCYLSPVEASDRGITMSVSGGEAKENAAIVLSGADTMDGKRFRLVLSSEYQPQNDGWVEQGDQKYWYDQGIRAQGKSIYDHEVGEWLWIDPDGTIAKDKDAYIPSNGGKWIRLDENGYMCKGEDYQDGSWYYFDPVTAAMVKGIIHIPVDGGKWVYYDWITGKMAHGECYVNYDAEHTGWYLFDKYTGAMYHGDTYVSSNGGKWVRYDHITGIMVHGLQKYDGSWYYFDQVTGAMAHGRAWVPEWGRWHYFDQVTGRG